MLKQKKILGTVGYLGGIPAIPEYFVWSWTNLVQYNAEALCGPTDTIYYDRATVSFHASARNDLVKRMKGDWLLQLDCDHLFEPDLLARLLLRLDKYDIDVLTGLYTYKAPPHAPVLFHTDADGVTRPMGGWDEKADIVEVDSAGAGCLLVKRSVFERIVRETHELPFDLRPKLTEDHSFFARLKECGIKAYCAPLVESHHVIPKALSLAHDYDRSLVQLGDPYTRSGMA